MSYCNFMANKMLLWLMLLLLGICNAHPESGELKTYIIHLDKSKMPESLLNDESWHRSIMKSLQHPADHEEMLVYSYNHVVHGFSAKLTQSQLSEIERSPAHLATYKESSIKLLTTHTPEFLGLNKKDGIWTTSSYGKNVIIGVVDSGIWPESESFNDKGMPPVPKRWKGYCENGTGFSSSSCNKKLIGARAFNKGLKASAGKISGEFPTDESPRDQEGHGTHVLSTAGGSPVEGVTYFGYAKGTATGMAPRAHVAMYKVQFSPYEGYLSDVLAGMDQAVADGVDILSLSIGFGELAPYYDNVIDIATLAAVEKGVFVVCAAGNSGPENSSVYNGAPWYASVGASTVDRSFTATLILADGTMLEGTSYYPQRVYITDVDLYYGKDNESKRECGTGTLNPTEVHGKIVVCEGSSPELQITELERVGALAGILVLDDVAISHVDPEAYSFPTLLLSTSSGALLKNYMANVTTAKVRSLKFVSTCLGTRPAPQVARFSSRGPDPISPGILKPDVIAPGVDVLAAFPPIPLMTIGQYDVYTDYLLASGTSMAAPHVAGVAALLKSVHREWSPAAIRSAIMTTACITDNTGGIIRDRHTGASATPLDFGAGHIDPNKAMNPGLIYDANFQDYVDFLCSLNYTKQQMSAVLRRSQWNCTSETKDLNYPSFITTFGSQSSFPLVKEFSRVVTNMGNDTSVYHAHLEPGSATGVMITVEPDTLAFTEIHQKQSFTLTISISTEAPPLVFSFLRWTDQYKHVVSSPIVAVSNASTQHYVTI